MELKFVHSAPLDVPFPMISCQFLAKNRGLFLHAFMHVQCAYVSTKKLHLANSGFLSRLTVLNLNENRLVSLPASISLLTELTQLSLSANTLSLLPPEVASLSRLSQLHLDGNRLTRLPEDLGKLKRLEKLFLQKNSLNSLPSVSPHLTLCEL